MPDFSLKMLEKLLLTFKEHDYEIIRFDNYWRNRDRFDNNNKTVLLRHDVDRCPETALATAKMEAEHNLFGTYFFRVKPWTFKKHIIQAIASLGHEIGYHYECLADANGDFEKAAQLCKQDLATLRDIAPVVSAAMHSRPLSQWDNRQFWDTYQLEEFGLRGETYRTIDHHQYMYIADSGRNWNADRNVIWDTVEGLQPPFMPNGTEGFIQAVKSEIFHRVQLLIHPNRWPEGTIAWFHQFLQDRTINLAKTLIRKKKEIFT
jgi:hypothetical protein